MKKVFNIIKKVFGTLCDCIIPVLPIMIGVGMIKVLLIVLRPIVLNVLKETDSTYIVLNFVAEAGFYFMPIYIGFSASEVFKTQKYLGALVGAMLISPTFVEIVKSNTPLSFLKLPIALTDYGNQILSSVISIWIMSYIYNFFDKHISDNFKSLLTPMLTILIMVPIAFCAIGPLGVFLGNKLIELIMLLKDIGPLGNAIMCALIPFILIFGLSGADVSSMILLAATGCDPILFFANVIFNVTTGFVTLATYLNKKQADTLAMSLTACVAGTSEPAIFGVIMKDYKALLSLVVGGFAGGLYAGLFGVKTFAMASFGIFGVVATIGPGSSIVHAIIAIIIASVVGFTLSFLLHLNKHE